MSEQQQSQLKTLIAHGKEQGFLTYAEVNDHLPDDIVDPEQIEEEIGDLFFTLVNLSRHMSIDAESSVRRSANKFEQRYRQMELLIQQDNLTVSELDVDTLESYWQRVKQQ